MFLDFHGIEKKPDIVFMVICLVAIGLCVAIYFLIPVLKGKEFARRRESLREREALFRANQKAERKPVVTVEPVQQEENFVEDTTKEEVTLEE